MGILRVIEKYDLEREAYIRCLEDENAKLRKELSEATAQIVQMADASSKSMLLASIAGLAMGSVNQEQSTALKKLVEINSD